MRNRMTIAPMLLSLLLSVAWLTAAAGTATPATGVADALQTEFYNINDAGDIVGAYVDAQHQRHGFLRINGGSDLTLDVSGAAWTEAWDLTNRADGKITVIGQYLSQQQTIKGFIAQYNLDPSAINPLSYTSVGLNAGGGAHTMPFGINDAGVIVGCLHSAGEADMNPWLLLGGSFLRSSQQATMYTDINNHGDVTGFGYSTSAVGGGQAFILKGQDVYPVSFSSPELGAATDTWIYRINDAGVVVGLFWDQSGKMHGFVRANDGSMESIDVPGVRMTHAYGINNNGVIVGAYLSGGAWHGFQLTP